MIAVTIALTLGLPDQPGRSTLDNVVRFIGERAMLLVVDNCEHLLDGIAAVITELLAGCPNLKALTTSREPIGIAGEVSWRVPSLSLDDDAVALFTDPRDVLVPNSGSPTTTSAWYATCAGASMVFRWLSNWRRRGCAPCRCRRSLRASTIASGY